MNYVQKENNKVAAIFLGCTTKSAKWNDKNLYYKDEITTGQIDESLTPEVIAPETLDEKIKRIIKEEAAKAVTE